MHVSGCVSGRWIHRCLEDIRTLSLRLSLLRTCNKINISLQKLSVDLQNVVWSTVVNPELTADNLDRLMLPTIAKFGACMVMLLEGV